MQQMSLTFQPGIGTQNRCLREHLAQQIYQRGLTLVAGKIDTSPSHLGEKLAGCSSDGKPRDVTVTELERYIAACGDLSPIYYLIDKFCKDPTVRREEALGKVTELLETLPALLHAAGIVPARKRA